MTRAYRGFHNIVDSVVDLDFIYGVDFDIWHCLYCLVILVVLVFRIHKDS